LFASGDSRTRGRLHPVWPCALRLGQKGIDANSAISVLMEAIACRATDFEVIHSHIDWLPLPLLGRLGVPFLTTMHGRLDLSSRFPTTNASLFRMRNGSARSHKPDFGFKRGDGKIRSSLRRCRSSPAAWR
jgi:hypothetical protein